MVKDFHAWLDKQPAKHIISVQGNHELWVEKNFQEAKALAKSVCPRVHFIGDGELVDIEGVKIYGSAVTPWFHNWAWNRWRGPNIQSYWQHIPEETQILITHGPVYGILDEIYYVDGVTLKERVGCYDLLEKIKTLPNLKFHICGHIHGAAGQKYVDGVHYINASICDEMYMPTQPIREFEI